MEGDSELRLEGPPEEDSEQNFNAELDVDLANPLEGRYTHGLKKQLGESCSQRFTDAWRRLKTELLPQFVCLVLAWTVNIVLLPKNGAEEVNWLNGFMWSMCMMLTAFFVVVLFFPVWVNHEKFKEVEGTRLLFLFGLILFSICTFAASVVPKKQRNLANEASYAGAAVTVTFLAWMVYVYKLKVSVAPEEAKHETLHSVCFLLCVWIGTMGIKITNASFVEWAMVLSRWFLGFLVGSVLNISLVSARKTAVVQQFTPKWAHFSLVFFTVQNSFAMALVDGPVDPLVAFPTIVLNFVLFILAWVLPRDPSTEGYGEISSDTAPLISDELLLA